MENLLAIIGRPNVGKSTLFNRLIGKRVSIVHDKPGITRDRLYHDISWNSYNFRIIDTGGVELSNEPFQKQITIQAQIAIEEATVIAIIVDGKLGITKDDRYIIDLVRKSGKPFFILANKLEGNKMLDSSIYTVGAPDIFAISALHGEGIGDALDKAITYMSKEKKDESDLPKISIIGRPNAGKSTLLNTLLGKERSIVSPIANTTRDSVKSKVDINGQIFEVIDTAGINKKSKLVESVEHYALARAFDSLEKADLSLMIIDSTREIAHFDARVAGYAMDNNKPLIIVINKWDLIKKDTNTMKKFESKIRKEFKFLSWAPIVFISAIEESRLSSLKETIINVWNNINKRIKTHLLNEMIIDIQTMQPAPSYNGGRLNISFAKQLNGRVPTFLFKVNKVEYLHFTYKRYIENQLREYFGFEGTPIKIVVSNKKGDK